MQADRTCDVRVVRHSGYADTLRRYKIHVNGEVVGSIARNSVLDLKVPSGPVTIEASIDWGRSEPLVVACSPGRPIVLEVANRWGVLLGFWAVSFGRKSYLVVRPASV